MAKKDKDPFEGVPEEFRDAIAGMDIVEIKKRVAEVALNQVELMTAKKADEDLASKAEIHKEAAAVYREGSKLNKTKIEYMKSIIENKGG